MTKIITQTKRCEDENVAGAYAFQDCILIDSPKTRSVETTASRTASG